MPTKKSTGLYRKLIQEAWSLTWERKALWIFGIFAALISTGGVVDVAFASLKKVRSGGSLLESLLNSSFVGYNLFAQYVNQLQLLGTGRVALILAAITIASLALFVMAIVSQAALILGAKSKHIPSPHTIRKEAWSHFWDLTIVAVLTKIANLLLVSLMTLPLLLLYIQTTHYHAWLFFILMIIFLPAIIVVNTISVLALMDIVHKGKRAIGAIEHAWRIFKKQWLAAFEFGFLLFLIVFGAGVIMISLLMLLSVPYAIIYTITLLTGSFGFFLFANVTFVLLVFLLFLFFGGGAVTFQYTAWYQFYKRASHRTHGKIHFSKYLRWFRG